MLSKERLQEIDEWFFEGGMWALPEVVKAFKDLRAEIERLEAASREKDERNSELDADINDLSLQLSNRTEDIETQARRIAELEATVARVVQYDKETHMWVSDFGSGVISQGVTTLEAIDAGKNALKLLIEAMTEQINGTHALLKAKEDENQKMAELLAHAPHEQGCAVVGYKEQLGPCDCWKKEADALLKPPREPQVPTPGGEAYSAGASKKST